MFTVFLASYPKSGNTWLRMLIGALSIPEGGEIDINALAINDSNAANRSWFEYQTLLDSSLLTFEEIDGLRPFVYRYSRGGGDACQADAAHGLSAVHFVKCHDAYTYLPDGTPLLGGGDGADRVVLIVRDPRDVAVSLANHASVDIDNAIALMENPEHCFGSSRNKLPQQLRQRLLTWSSYYQSWLDQGDVPVLLIRYEEMHQDVAGVLERVLSFAGISEERQNLLRAVGMADFRVISEKERTAGFCEAPRRMKSNKFFRRGIAGAWKDELTDEQVLRIETGHWAMMTRLGYVPAKVCGTNPSKGS